MFSDSNESSFIARGSLNVKEFVIELNKKITEILPKILRLIAVV